MKNWLTNATKKRLIREIRKILYDHPRYRDDSNNVQNKYSFDERPQRGVIINNTTADQIRLAPDNYMGRLSSFVMQAQVGNNPGTTLEWAIENKLYLEKFSPRRDVFPSPPGIYIIEVQSLPDEARNIPGYFTIDPNLLEQNEKLITFNAATGQQGQLSRSGIVPGSVRLWLDGRSLLLDGVDYSVDNSGFVVFLKKSIAGDIVYADYKYIIDKQGPFPFKYEESDLSSIPGTILAFGNRAVESDKIAIVISNERVDVAESYGGKFLLHFSLVVFSRDAEDREKLSDHIVVSILSRQNELGYEGLELIEISPGGESEEVYNDELDEFYYDGSISISFRVDWEIYEPMPVEILRIDSVSKSKEQVHGYLDGTSTYDLIHNPSSPFDLVGVAFNSGKDITFERIR